MPTDPANLTPDQRRREIAAILAKGVLRLRSVAPGRWPSASHLLCFSRLQPGFSPPKSCTHPSEPGAALRRSALSAAWTDIQALAVTRKKGMMAFMNRVNALAC